MSAHFLLSWKVGRSGFPLLGQGLGPWERPSKSALKFPVLTTPLTGRWEIEG